MKHSAGKMYTNVVGHEIAKGIAEAQKKPPPKRRL
jgi:hypothetical protein